MTSTSRLVIGTHTYAAKGGNAERQADSVGSLMQLARADVVNLQFVDGAHHADGVPTVAALKRDAPGVTGRSGPRKGILTEMFDVLAAEASSRGLRYFCFTNGDIIWSQRAVDRILDGGKEAYAFSRRDFDAATGADGGIELSGVDAVAIDAAWWRAHRARFRGYIVGEICWDNVYTAILMCHADAELENRTGLIRHARHPSGPTPNPAFADYIRYLTALDAPYFHLWCCYWGRVGVLRQGGAPAEDELQLARDVFVWRPTPAARLSQAARGLKARVRYGAARLGIG